MLTEKSKQLFQYIFSVEFKKNLDKGIKNELKMLHESGRI